MKGSSNDTMTDTWTMEDLMIESPGRVTWSYVYDCDGDSMMDIMDEAGTAYIDVVTFKPHLSPTGLPTSTPSHSPSHSSSHEPSRDSLPTSDPLSDDCPAEEDNCQPGGCEGACKGAQGQIGSGSCLGEEMTCVDLDGFVGTDSCRGLEACKNLIGMYMSMYIFHISSFYDTSSKSPFVFYLFRYIGKVGNDSCLLDHACQNSTKAEIGTRSCNGEESCKDNTADISDYSCQGGEACTMNKAKIGTRSCQATGSSSKACFHNEGSIGDDSVSKLAHFVHLLRHF